MRLTELAAVTVEERTDDAFAVVGGGVRSARLGSNTGRARLVLVARDDTRVPLTPWPLAHSECMEWLPEVRRFLRAQGWTPPGS